MVKQIIKGEHNYAKIFTDVADEKSLEQVKTLCDQEFTKGSRIRMMPDIHAGAGCTIGTTMTITDKVVPNLVGVDIGCGMLCVRLKEKEIDLEKLDRVIREHIPSGFNVRTKPDPTESTIFLENLFCFNSIDYERAKLSIGTLGGGNHFIEIDKDEETGDLYLVIHSGSRHLGVEVAEYYQELAYENLLLVWGLTKDMIIDRLRKEGKERDISEALKVLGKFDIPKDLCWLEGSCFDNYIHDMKLVQEFAKRNRISMAGTILDEMNLWADEAFTTIHNYIDTENMILRKGAVSAQDGEKLLIPINMRDGSLICVGKGNPDWNYSAPHGAGRLFGRMAAKKNFSVAEYRDAMDGIYTTSVNDDTLDECPMAYKSMDDIVNNIGETVDILKVIKPIYNFKASGD